jgi:hypothetical protein
VKTIKAFIKSYPVLTYFVLAFTITWGGIVLAVGPSGIPATKDQFTTMPFLAYGLASAAATWVVVGALAVGGAVRDIGQKLTGEDNNRSLQRRLSAPRFGPERGRNVQACGQSHDSRPAAMRQALSCSGSSNHLENTLLDRIRGAHQ